MSAKSGDKSEDICDKVFMNPKLVIKIFSYLSIDELIPLERVCKHFQSCAESCFGQQKSIAFNTCIVKQRFKPMDDLSCDLYAFPERLLETQLDGSLVLSLNRDLMLCLAKKLPNIEYLAINHFSIDYKTLYAVLEAFQSVKWLSICGLTHLTERQSQQLGQLLSPRVTTFMANPCLEHNKQGVDGVVKLIAQLTGLTHLYVFVDKRDAVIELLHGLPQTIKSLQINNTCFDEHLVQLVESNAKQLDSLLIHSSVNIPFDPIIDGMDLKAFGYGLNQPNGWQCLQRLAQKQTLLTYLRLNFQHFPDFDVTKNAIQLSNVKTLHLYSSHPRKEAFESLMKCLPELKTLVLFDTYIACNCDDNTNGNNCLKCFEQMYDLMAKHTTIKTLGLSYYQLFEKTAVLCQKLNEFRDLSAIQLDYDYNRYNEGFYANICRQFVSDFIDLYTRNPKKWYTIRVHKDITQDFCSGLQIPRNLSVRRDLH